MQPAIIIAAALLTALVASRLAGASRPGIGELIMGLAAGGATTSVMAAFGAFGESAGGLGLLLACGLSLGLVSLRWSTILRG